MTDTQTTILRLLAVNTGRKQGAISPLADLYTDLKMDEMDFKLFVFAVETAFDIHIPNENLQQFHTASQFAHYIDHYLNN